MDAERFRRVKQVLEARAIRRSHVRFVWPVKVTEHGGRIEDALRGALGPLLLREAYEMDRVELAEARRVRGAPPHARRPVGRRAGRLLEAPAHAGGRVGEGPGRVVNAPVRVPQPRERREHG